MGSPSGSEAAAVHLMGVPTFWGLVGFGVRLVTVGGWLAAGAGFTLNGVTLKASQLSGAAWFPSLTQTFTS